MNDISSVRYSSPAIYTPCASPEDPPILPEDPPGRTDGTGHPPGPQVPEDRGGMNEVTPMGTEPTEGTPTGPIDSDPFPGGDAFWLRA